MGLTDKILLGLLIVLLPLGLIVSRQFFQPEDPEASDTRTEQLAKIETLLNELSDQEISSAPDTPTMPVIRLDQISFASESGSLKVRGVNANYNLLVQLEVVEYLPETTNTQNLAVSNAKALGKQVVHEAVKPNADGSFEYEYLPEKKDVYIEVTVRQLGMADVAVFDLIQEKLVYEANP
jgi:hypothetical protein